MKFTYLYYKALLELLSSMDYHFCDYSNYNDWRRSVIIAHNVDFSLDYALKMAEIEHSENVRSMWFLNIRSDFYNLGTKSGQAAVNQLLKLKHKIGLHFDASAYYGLTYNRGAFYNSSEVYEKLIDAVIDECNVLSSFMGGGIRTFSLHNATRELIKMDLKVPGVFNASGKDFLKKVKYVTDNNRRWRDPILEYVRTEKFEKLHIMMHPFWYREKSENISKSLVKFVNSAGRERYACLGECVPNIESVLPAEDVGL